MSRRNESESFSKSRTSARNRRRSRRFNPLNLPLEDRVLLAASIVDIEVLEGNDGPASVTATLAKGTETHLYRFTGTAGQEIYFDNISASSTAAQWRLYAPNGGQLTSANIKSDFRYVLPTDGAYVLSVVGQGSESSTLDYSFRLFDVTAPPVELSGPFGEVVTGTVTTGGQKILTFTAPAGQRIYIDNLVRSGPTLQLLSPSGSSIEYIYSSNYDSAPIFLAESGTYQIIAYSGTGAYKFRLDSLPDAATPLTLGQTVSGQASDHATALYKFDAQIGQRLYFDGQQLNENGVQARLFSPSGSVPINLNAAHDAGPFTLGQSGTYWLTLEGREAGEHNYKFRLIDTADEPTEDLTLGAETTGSFAANQTSQTHLYRFDAVAGQRIFIDTISANVNNAAYWRIYAPNNQELMSNWINTSGSGDGEVVAPSSGTYLLAVQGQGRGAAVDYKLVAHAITATAPTPIDADGEIVSGSIDTPGEYIDYVFEGAVGQRLYFDGIAGSNITAQLFAPNGNSIFSVWLPSDHGSFTLTHAGTYRLRIDGSGDATGAYAFRLIDAAAAPTRDYAPGDVAAGSFAVGETAQIHLYRFNAQAGHRLYFDALSTNVSAGADWYVYGPDNQRLMSNSFYTGGRYDGEVNAPATGTYLLAIVGRGGSAAVDYSFALHATTLATVGDPIPIGTDGEIVSGSIDVPGEYIDYVFTGAVGQRLYFDGLAGANINAQLFAPNGNSIFSVWLPDDHGAFTLTQAGTYRLRIDGRENTTGAYAFRLIDAAAAPTQDYALGDVAAGSFAVGETAQIHLYRFNAQAGQRLYFDALSTNVNVGTYWYVYGPNNQQLMGSYFSSSGRYDGEAVAPTTGTYLLAIVGQGGSEAVDYSFALHATTAAAPTPIEADGEIVSGSIDTPGQIVDYLFEGAVGQRLYFDGLAGANFNAQLFAPNGNSVFSVRLPEDHGSFTLTQAGTYRLRIDGRENTTGAYAFRLIDAAAAPTQTYAPGDVAAGSFAVGETAQIHLYRFNAQAGQRLYFDALSTNVNVGTYWYVYGPNNQQLMGSYFSSSGRYDGEAVAPTTGTYLLAIVGQGGSEAVDYSFALHATTAAAPTPIEADGEIVSGSIGTPGQIVDYLFEGAVGQRIYFDGIAGANITAQLFTPSGSSLFSRPISADNEPITLTQAGTYRLRIDGSGDATGAYSFRLLDAAAAPTQALASGETVSGSFAADKTRQIRLYRFNAEAGDRIHMDVLSTNINYGVYWYLYGPTNQQLGGNAFLTDGRYDGEVVAPTSGTYLLAIVPQGGNAAVNYEFKAAITTPASVTPAGFGTTVSGTLAAGQVFEHVFEASAGTPIFFDSMIADSQPLYVEFLRPDGSVIANINVASDYGPYLLPQSGAYKLRVRGNNSSSTGSYAFRVLNLADAPTLAPGAAVSGSLADRSDHFYRLDGVVGQRLIIDPLSDPNTYNRIVLYGPDFSTVTNDYFYDTSPFTLTQSGVYFARVWNSQNQNLSYSFQVLDLDDAQSIAMDETISGTIDPALSIHLHKFTGTAGQRVYIDFLTASPSNGADWYLYGPANQHVTSNNVNPNGDREVTLSVDGEYVLAVRGQTTTGKVDYSFRVVGSQTTTSALTLGQTTTGTLAKPGDQRHYTFNGAIGQRLVFDGLSSASGLYIGLFNPSGSRIAYGTWSYTPAGDIEPITLVEPGVYTLAVYGNSGATGDYAFRMLDVADASAVALDATAAGTLDPGLSTNLHKFTGTAGQRIYVDFLTASPNNGADWYLYGPANQSITSHSVNPNGDREIALPTNGEYLLVVHGRTNTGKVDYSFNVRAAATSTSTLTLGETTTGTLAEPGDQHKYTFNGAIGQRLIFDGLSSASGLYIGLFNPSGSRIAYGTWSYTPASDIEPITLVEPGVYTLAVYGNGGATGDYSFRMLDVAEAETIALDATAAGTLDPGRSANLHKFSGTAGQRIYIDFLTSSPNNGASWYLYGPANQHITSNNVNPNGDAEATLPIDGEYVLVVYGQTNTGKVDYSFRVRDPEAPIGDLTFGQITTGTLAKPGDQRHYTFNGAIGQRLIFDGLSSANGLYIGLFNPSGSRIAYGTWSYTPASDIEPITLVEPGVYTLAVYGNGGATGDYSFRMLDVAEAETIALDATAAGTLDPGRSANLHKFTGTAGQRIFVDFLSSTPNNGASWYLYGPNNQYIASHNTTAGGDAEITLPVNGEYVLVIRGNTATGKVDYSFRVVAPETTTSALTLNETTTGTIAKPGDRRVYTFDGTAGQKVVFDGLSSSSGNLRATVYDPFGGQLATLGAGEDSGVLTLFYPGSYRVVVAAYASNETTGNYAFRLLNVDDAPAPQIGTHKAVVAVTLSEARTNQTYFQYRTEPGTATADEDYVSISNTLYFAPGVTMREIVIPIIGDTIVEDDETFLIRLTGSNDTISKAVGQVTILNDDTQITAAIDDVIKLEGSDGGTTDFVFTVTLSEASSQVVTIDYATADGSAKAGEDYIAQSGTLTFNPGEKTKTITIKVVADTDGEADETFFVNLSNPTNVLIADGQGKGTILNDDAKVAISDVVVVEGDSGKTKAVFTITLSTPSNLPVSVNYATADGSATSPSDYTAASGQITFAPGEVSKTIEIDVVGDSTPEPDEVFYVNLTDAGNASFAKAQGKATIRNDDAAITIYDNGITEGNSGTKILRFQVSIPYVSTKTVSVNYKTVDGTATAGEDYEAASGTVTFNPGETTKYIDVVINGDTLAEPHEVFYIDLSDATNATIARARAAGTIHNDDTTIVIDDASIVEGDSGVSTVSVTVRLTVASTETVTVQYATADGTAKAGEDYTAKSGTLTFAPGQTSQTIALTIHGDETVEPDEYFFVNLSDASSAIIADAQARVTIRNDDAALSINDAQISEGDSGARAMSFVVSLPYATTKTVTVAFATEDGTATAGEDYVAKSGTLTFTPGETSKVITVDVLGDVLDENDETFFVVLSDAANATIAKARGTGTIIDDDAPVSIAIGNASVDEGGALSFTVTLSAKSGKTITASYATADGSAEAGKDYKAASGTLTFAPGETTKTITVQTIDDDLNEFDETVFVNLSNIVNATVAQARGVGTIVDNDPEPTLSIADAAIDEGDSGATDLAFTVRLSSASGKAVTVHYKTIDGTATAGEDYEAAEGSLVFEPGQTSATIIVKVKGDTLVEPDETFTVQLGGALNATISRGAATGTILNDDEKADPGPTVSTLAVDDGTEQRSLVRSLTVAFDQVVNIAEGAFEVRTLGGSLVSATINARTEAGRTVVVLSFAGRGLDDGDYRLSIFADKITNAAGVNLQAGAHDAVIHDFHRLFGDLDGDRDVDALDYAKLQRAMRLGEYLGYLDFDGDGDLDMDDVTAFRLRFGRRL